MGLDHPLDGITNPKYKLLHFLTTNFFCEEKKTSAFNRDRCRHLVLCFPLQITHQKREKKEEQIGICTTFQIRVELDLKQSNFIE